MYVNNYTLLVAVICSAQSTDASVNKATDGLFKTIDSPEKMLELGEDRLKSHIKSIGLFNAKAKNIIEMSKILINSYNGIVPSTLLELIALPGVGRKTANVILNCAFNLPTMAVDTHVFRVGNRIGLTKARNVVESEKQLLENIPPEWLLDAHHWLILHGRYTCKARKPECGKCIIQALCEYPDKNFDSRHLPTTN